MIEINLVPDVKQELIHAQRIRSAVITVVILIGLISISIVAVLVFYIFVVQTARGAILDGQIDSGSKKLEKIDDLSKTLTFQNQLTKITELNDNKKIDSRIFDVLKAIIPPAPNDVKFSDLTIKSTENRVTFVGQAFNSYAALEVFKKTLAGAKVNYTDSEGKSQSKVLASDISTNDVSYGEDSSGLKILRFTISFKYIQELFSPQSKKVSVIITNKGNATDSYLGTPSSFFADRPADIKEVK